jgi:hypothetical protein
MQKITPEVVVGRADGTHITFNANDMPPPAGVSRSQIHRRQPDLQIDTLSSGRSSPGTNIVSISAKDGSPVSVHHTYNYGNPSQTRIEDKPTTAVSSVKCPTCGRAAPPTNTPNPSPTIGSSVSHRDPDGAPISTSMPFGEAFRGFSGPPTNCSSVNSLRSGQPMVTRLNTPISATGLRPILPRGAPVRQGSSAANGVAHITRPSATGSEPPALGPDYSGSRPDQAQPNTKKRKYN